MGEVKNLHTNPILQILVSKDQKKIVTCGRDKKVKAYDWINDKVIASLTSHAGNVQSIVFSNDEKYLFSSGDDKRIVVWHADLWVELCSLTNDFPIYTLNLSLDSQFLMCNDKLKGKVCFWKLEENKDAIRLNLSIKAI